jgi:hypothetical protein
VPQKTLPPVPFSEIKPLSSVGPGKSPSYALTVPAGTPFEIPLTGTSWSYTGIASGNQGIRFEKKRIQDNQSFFSYTPVIPGEYLLEFLRQDLLLDSSEYEYVKVVVTPKADSTPTPFLPLPTATPRPSPSAPSDWINPILGAGPSPTPSGLSDGGTDGLDTGTDTMGLATSSASPLGGSPKGGPSQSPAAGTSTSANQSSADLLKGITEALKASKGNDARALFANYQAQYPETDYALWLEAQCAEAPGSGRDMLLARDLYARLVQDYPESDYVDQASRRIEYINRRFLEIR